MIAILVYTLLFSITFYNLGLILNHKFNFNLNPWLFFPLGLSAWFGVIQFLIYPVVWLKIPTMVFFVILGLMIILINILGLLSKDRPRFNKSDAVYYSGMIFFVIIMVYFAAQRTLGQNSFDTNFYLSMVVQGASSRTFSFVEYGTGLVKDIVNTQYDFQSFYAFGSFILASFEPVIRLMNPGYFTISTNVFIWTISILFYTFEYSLIFGMARDIKVLKNPVFAFIVLLFLGYNGFIYYNQVFAFFGNTYRTWILAFLMMEIYKSITSKSNKAVLMLLLSSALISVSSTGFFLGIIVLTPYVMFQFKTELSHRRLIENIGIIIFPTLLFTLFYLGTNNSTIFVSLLIVFLLLFVFLYALYRSKSSKVAPIVSFVRYFILFGIPILMLSYSTSTYLQGSNLPVDFFFDHRAYDMVWYYFNTESVVHIFINIVYFISLLGYLFFINGRYRLYIIGLLILFINPISSLFVTRFLASVVYYRSFEVIFNPFTVLLFSTSVISLVKPKWISGIISVTLLLGFLPSAIQHSQLYYHNSFLPSEHYSSLYRVESSQIETLSVLKTKIALEAYAPARVVSQIEMVRGFVPNVVTPISNEMIRSINRYTINAEKSKLLTIFMNRDFIGQEIFDVVPDYANTCHYLIDERIDFVVVSKNQFYIDEKGIIIPLYFKVRDCATPVFENTDYFIYQFYW